MPGLGCAAPGSAGVLAGIGPGVDADVDASGAGAIPAGINSIRHGDRWLAAGRSTLLRVPSVLVPREDNVLIHPRHPDTAKLRVHKRERVSYDPRLRA